MQVRINIYIDTCIYICIYTYIHMYIHIYIYIYTQIGIFMQFQQTFGPDIGCTFQDVLFLPVTRNNTLPLNDRVVKGGWKPCCLQLGSGWAHTWNISTEALPKLQI